MVEKMSNESEKKLEGTKLRINGDDNVYELGKAEPPRLHALVRETPKMYRVLYCFCDEEGLFLPEQIEVAVKDQISSVGVKRFLSQLEKEKMITSVIMKPCQDSGDKNEVKTVKFYQITAKGWEKRYRIGEKYKHPHASFVLPFLPSFDQWKYEARKAAEKAKKAEEEERSKLQL